MMLAWNTSFGMATVFRCCRLFSQTRRVTLQSQVASSRQLYSINGSRDYISCQSKAVWKPLSAKNIKGQPFNHTGHQPARTFLSALSATGFNDYELGRKQFKLEVPEYFNFASDILDEWARQEQEGSKESKNPAFWWIGSQGNELKWTFTDLQHKSKRVANILDKDCNLTRGDSVMVILPRVPEWWLLNIACLRTGTILIPGCSTDLTARDIKDRLQASATVCIITDDETAPLVDEVISECGNVRCKLLVSQTGDSRPGWLDYQQLYQQASSEHQCLKTKSDEPMTIFFTSGSTGKPKMALHTHASYGLGHVITGKYWLDLTPTDVHWNISDPGWAKSAIKLFAAWTLGACIFISHTPEFDPEYTLELLQKYPISGFCAPATNFRMMVQQDLKKYDLKSVRHTASVGEPLNPEVINAWKAGTGSWILEGYGQTEIAMLTGMFKCLKPKPGSMGKPAPGYKVHIVDDEGNRLAEGEEGNVGVLVQPHRPVGLFTHYVGEPERTAKVFKGDYYLTGDRAMCDDDGYLWFVGRGDDIISSAGYRIGPFEVESALIEHPAVAELAVVSSPDPTRGEVVKAFIVLTENYSSKDKKQLVTEIQEHVKKITSSYKYPRKVEFVESLPKTMSGKIRRVQLRNDEWNR